MSDNKSRTIQRRHSQVYIDVPLPAHPRPSTSSEQSLKENTPLRPSRTNSQSLMATPGNDGTASKKRRLLEDDTHDASDEPLSTKAKKARVASAPQTSEKREGAQIKKPKATTTSPADTPSEEYPHGYFYCHQCNRKRDRSEGVHCTFKNPRAKASDGRCGARYCKACLKNRYHQDMDVIMSRDPSELSKKQREGHILSDGYYFQCPKCQDDCNCRLCRKAKGLEPTGNLNLKARQAEKAAAAKANAKHGAGAGSSTQAKSRKPAAKKSEKTLKPPEAQSTSKGAKATKPAPKPKAKPASKPKLLPKPVWTRVTTELSHDDAVARLHIREFCVRFASAMQLSQGQLDELEEPSGDNLGPAGGWDVDADSDHDIIAWVGELCARSIIQGLLELIVGAAKARDEHDDAKAIQNAARAVKASGANLNRVWGALVTLREELESDWLAFPDPTPPPASTAVRATRSGLQNKEGQHIHIVSSAQLIPVITNLIYAALDSSPIRDLLEAGAAEEKELGKNVREAVVNENTRWKNFTGTKDKARREQHNKLLRNLDYSNRILAPRYIPRFSPLGRDSEGRVYYAPSPGVGETDAALQFIHGKDGKPKVGRKRVFDEDERREMQRWSWFIAVWGKKPEGAEEATNEEEDEDEDEDEEHNEDEDSWWGFWQPAEVRKLAEWLAIKADVADDLVDSTPGSVTQSKAKGGASSSKLSSLAASRAVSPLSDLSDGEDGDIQMQIDSIGRCPPAKRELSELVTGLQGYAELLEWRIQRVTGELPVEKAGKTVQKTSPVPASKFYA